MEVPATKIPASQLLTEDITNIIPYLDKYGVCVVPLKNKGDYIAKIEKIGNVKSVIR